MEKYSEEERQFLEEIAFKRIQLLSKDQLQQVARKFELNDTGTKLCLFKVILGYFSSIATTSDEGLKRFVELNELLHKFFIKRCLKEPPKTSETEKLQTDLLSSQNELSHITKFREFKINGKIGTPGQKE